MALVPGVVKFNYRFWHPDSIIILLILLTLFFLEKDRLKFGRMFFLAAVTCGLATAIKLWGLFFVLAIGGYLLAGVMQKKISLKIALISGLEFILVMMGTIVITSPGLLAPYIRNGALQGWATQQNSLLHGYNEPDPTGAYATGISNWLKFFGYYFMKPFFFLFAVISLLIGSIWGSQKTLNRLVLAWCVVVVIFLFTFTAMKAFQYMLPLMLPLFLGALLFPSAGEIFSNISTPKFLASPLARKVLLGIPILVFSIQFIINIGIIISSPMMGY